MAKDKDGVPSLEDLVKSENKAADAAERVAKRAANAIQKAFGEERKQTLAALKDTNKQELDALFSRLKARKKAETDWAKFADQVRTGAAKTQIKLAQMEEAKETKARKERVAAKTKERKDSEKLDFANMDRIRTVRKRKDAADRSFDLRQATARAKQDTSFRLGVADKLNAAMKDKSKQNAKASLKDLAGQVHQAIPNAPAGLPELPLLTKDISHIDPDVKPEVLAREARRAKLSRLTGGRFFRPEARKMSDFVGEEGPTQGPSLLRRGLNRYNSGIDSIMGFNKAQKEQGKLDVVEKFALALKGSPGALALTAGATAATAALGVLGGTLNLVKKAFFATWEYIDTKVLPTQSMLNKTFGTSTEGLKGMQKQAMSTGLMFERLGLGFEHGAQLVKDIGVGFKSVKISDQDLGTLERVGEYVGVGGEQAGKMARSFQAAGMSVKDFDKSMVQAAVVAKAYDVPVNLIRKDFVENIDTLSRWGYTHTVEFNRAIAKAQSYGIEAKDMFQTFGEQFDTFEHSAQVAANLNAAFGTQLDSMELMNATEDERMDMVQKAIERTGFVWNGTNKFLQNILKSELQLKDNDTGLRMFGTDADRLMAKKRVEEQKQLARGTDEWQKGLSSLGMQLTSVEQLTRKFFMAINHVVMKLLGFKSGIDGTESAVKMFEKFMDTLSGKIEDFADALPQNENGTGAGFVQFLRDVTRMMGQLETSAFDVVQAFDSMTHLGTGGAIDYSRRFAELYAKKDTAGLAALQTEMQKTGFYDPEAYKRYAAQRAHILPNQVEGAMQGYNYGTAANAVPQGQGPLLNAPAPPIIVNFQVGSKQVAQAIVDQTSRQAVVGGN